MLSTERIVSRKTLETGDVTSQPGSPGQPRVAPYQSDSPYLRVPPDFGVTVVVVGEVVVVVVGGLVVVVVGGADVVVVVVAGWLVVVVEVGVVLQPINSKLIMIITRGRIIQYFFMFLLK